MSQECCFSRPYSGECFLWLCSSLIYEASPLGTSAFWQFSTNRSTFQRCLQLLWPLLQFVPFQLRLRRRPEQSSPVFLQIPVAGLGSQCNQVLVFHQNLQFSVSSILVSVSEIVLHHPPVSLFLRKKVGVSFSSYLLEIFSDVISLISNIWELKIQVLYKITSKSLIRGQEIEHLNIWRFNKVKIILVDLDLKCSYCDKIGHTREVYLSLHAWPSKNMMLLRLTLYVINGFIYLKRTLMSTFSIKQVSKHLHK